MKLSIFTTTTQAEIRGDNKKDAIACYKELADEVVVVDGGLGVVRFVMMATNDGILINSPWKQEFSWEFIGQQFQKGYEACTGDIVIHADLDFIWHQRDFIKIREKAQTMLNHNYPAMSMWKYQFILPDRYNLKSRLVTMVNKKAYGDRIKFNSGGDLCQPSLDGVELSPNDVPQAEIPIYNYEKLLKTKEQIANDQGRMERAWFTLHGQYQMGSDGTDINAYDKWVKAQVGKFSKPQKKIPLSEHPKYVQETIKNLKPENWGYNGFGYLENNDYVVL